MVWRLVGLFAQELSDVSVEDIATNIRVRSYVRN
jgi:hypothetical protein